MVTSEQGLQDTVREHLEAIFERALTAYHRDELHGAARWVEDRMLDAELVPVAREAFLEADDLPDDSQVLHKLHTVSMSLLGEGYHAIALVEPEGRFVVKYAKSPGPVPPLGPAEGASPDEWWRCHGVRPDGTLHPAIWQHIRAFEAYGPLGVCNRVYIADSAFDSLAAAERRMLERFRSIGIVRSLGPDAAAVRVDYPDHFPPHKRAPGAVVVSVAVVQPFVIPISTAIEQALRSGDVAAARDLEARSQEFTQQLWRCGISHLDFSLLNIGVVRSERRARLQIFDPHIGEIDVAGGGGEVRDPLSTDPEKQPLDQILRSSRDGSRWALWRVQQEVSSSDEVPQEGAEGAAAIVREFHDASEGLEEGRGSFGFDRFDRTWRQRRTHVVNTVMYAQLWALLKHPVAELLRATLDPGAPDAVFDRTLAVLGMHDDRPLAQFRAGLKAHEEHPLVIVVNLSDHPSKRTKHWGRVQVPPELDVQDDPAIHYHLRDLFTGEVYVSPGDVLARRGFIVGLAPHELHVLRVEDVTIGDLAVEAALAADRDISGFLRECTKRVGVVGDVHGELQALREVLDALGFIDSLGRWSARDGTLVLTGDVGHGRHLQEVFDFIHRLAGQAHTFGGRIVWTLGNHDLFVDREGGQGGEDSMGYRLWPTIREAALHPERHPGLRVQAAWFEHGKLFVHGGVLPNIVELATRERGAGDAETVAGWVNDVLRRTLVERERITARDLPHEIFCIGTSHARERRMPGEIGYEPAGVFTPDLRELDHYRYHDTLLPQVVGHTASRRGEIRYAPGSWLRRAYIAIDVGRQHGTGNGGLLLTDFGWVAVTPGGPARLVEVTPLFVREARGAVLATWRENQGEAHVRQVLAEYFEATKPEGRPQGEVPEALFAELSPTQVVSLERFIRATRQTGRCVILTELGDALTAFAGGLTHEDAIEVLTQYLDAGGVLVISTRAPFDWCYVRLLRSLVLELGARSRRLAHVFLVLSGGREIFAFEDGAYRLMSRLASRDPAAALDVLASHAGERAHDGTSLIDPVAMAYIGDSKAPGGWEEATASRAGVAVDVGDAMPGAAGAPVTRYHRSHHRAMDVIVAATAALRESGLTAPPPAPPDVGPTMLWTLDRRHFPPGCRVRVRVNGSGFVHAGITRPDRTWDPVFNVPLLPLPEGGHEAVLPAGIDAFTIFWTEAPWTEGRPGHWERDHAGPRVYTARGLAPGELTRSRG